MKDTFHQYLPYTENQIKEIWSSGLIIPDANVLLNVYRYSEETCQQFLSREYLRGQAWQLGFTP